MTQFGSSRGMISQNLSQTVDGQGNPIISTDTTFGASPLGYAPLVQSLFGLPNATFQLTPPDTASPISSSNPLPYWDLAEDSESQMSGSAIYDTATGTWGVNLSPGTAATASTLTFTTRSFLVNDDNLALRQKALAVVSKQGTYAGTSQWNMTLTASYYDHNNELLHSGTVATIYDNTTWTSMSGTTTTSGTAINAAAVYVDLAFVMTTTAAVTSATSVTIKSLLLQTAGAATGSFVVTETFTSSQTWTRPTSVTSLIAVVGQGGGGGGGGGATGFGTSVAATTINGASGGGGGAFGIVRDVNIGTASSFSVGVGSKGSGGSADFRRAVGGVVTTGTATNGAAGGASTFGTVITFGGGGGGIKGSAATGGTAAVSGGAGGAASTTLFSGGALFYSGGTGGGVAIGSASTPASGTNGAASSASTTGGTPYPYFAGTIGAGSSGGTPSPLTFSYSNPGSGGAANIVGGGGGGGGREVPRAVGQGGLVGGDGGSGGAGGAGGAFGNNNLGFGVYLAGNGGNAGTISGAGGGGGGACHSRSTPGTANAGTANAGTGGNGGDGWLVIAYVS